MKKILLISGHGAGDSGACAKIGGTTYKEAEQTVVMAKKIKKALGCYDVQVDLYPVSKNAYEDLKSGKMIDFVKYDYVLEVHFNSCVRDLKGNGKTTGTEILLPTKCTQKDTSLEKDIVKRVAAVGFANRGVKTQQLLVINTSSLQGTKASLLEVCFIDDADDISIYNKKKETIANAIAKAFVAKWGLKKVATITKKAALRKDKIVNPANRICWIPANTRVIIKEEYPKWIKVTYSGHTGYVVKSKVSL